MRTAFILGALLTIGLVVSNTGCTKASAATKVCTLKVEGLTCATCEPPVKKAAKALEGVWSAEVSWKEGAATITYDPAKTTPEAIASVINNGTPYKAAVVATAP